MSNKNKEKNDEKKVLPGLPINWYKPTLINFQADLDFISLFI